MAGSLTDYAESKLVDHVTGLTTYTKPTATYLGLFTAAPSDTGGGTEVSGGSYARVAITWSAATAGVTANSAAITFPTASGSWGTITHVGVFDALTTGNLLAWSDLAVSKAVASGDGFEIPIGDLDFTLT
jgi:hypothetical protein